MSITSRLIHRLLPTSILLLLCLAAPVRAAPKLPNVVVLLSDDLGWRDIGCYDGPVQTPTLDRLAAGGTRFTNFYSGAAVCSPSRAVLLTGRTNLRSGIYSWINDYDQRSHLPRDEQTLAEVLQRNGYATAHFGKWHLGMPTDRYPNKPSPSDHGFDEWLATINNAQPSHRSPRNFIHNGKAIGQQAGYACDLVIDDAIRWLDGRPNPETPFFLNVWLHEPHAPLAAPLELVRRYGDDSDPAAIYSATIANTDQAIGRLVDKLQQMHAPEDTLIIYSSDNGSYRSDRVGSLRGTKGSNYEGGIRVPGIFYWPTRIPSRRVTDEPAGLIDILPTVCGLLGIQPPDRTLDGTDISGFLTEDNHPLKRQQPLFWMLPLAGPAVAIREGRYSMVGYRHGGLPRDERAIAQIKREIETTLREKGIYEAETRAGGFSKQLFEGFVDPDAEKLRGQFIRLNQFHESWIPAIKASRFDRFELYDLIDDPGQTQNIANRHPQVYHRLKSQLEAIAASVLEEAVDWSVDPASSQPRNGGNQSVPSKPSPDDAKPIQKSQATTRVHRLEITFRSPFDAFSYVNRIPMRAEVDETPEDLAGRILGRLANQEGRVLVKLPPGMSLDAYQGFKTALDGTAESESASCVRCHRLPEFGREKATPRVPTLRNRSWSRQQLQTAMNSETHQSIRLESQDLRRLHAFLRSLDDVGDVEFRNLILQATVIDTTEDSR